MPRTGFFLSNLVTLVTLGVDDADLAGRATASSFTMVTRRNLCAMGMGRFVVFYWRGWRLFLMETLWSRGAQEEIAFSVDPCNSLLGRSRIMFPSAGAGSCQC